MASNVGASSPALKPVDEESSKEVVALRPSGPMPPTPSSVGMGIKPPVSFSKAAEYLSRAFGGGTAKTPSPPGGNVAGDGAEILDAAELLVHFQSSKVNESLQGASVKAAKGRADGGASAKGGDGGKAQAGGEGAHSAKGNQGFKAVPTGRTGVKSLEKRAVVAGVAAPRVGVKSPEQPVEGKRPKVVTKKKR
ncbi:hypothetical protein T484DRAFT_1920234 [Baffinella frigidus]|nr:hypothetical protein T484DRAFT_1920234 [Cryptophyta sp. CCMP2293]